MRLKQQSIRLLLGAFFLLVISASVALAEVDESTLRSTIDGKASELSALEAEIAQYQLQLNVLGKNKDTLANTLNRLSLESKKLGADIALTQGKIAQKNTEIKSLGTSITTTSGQIVDLRTALAKTIHEIEARDTSTQIPILFAQQNLSDVWHYVGQQNAFQKSIQKRTVELANVKTILVTDKTRVESAKKELIVLQGQIEDQKAINQKTQNQQQVLLKATKNQESQYQKIVSDKQKLKTQLEADLRSYESQLKYVLNKKLLPKARGILAWPLSKVIVTQSFGKTADSGRLYASGSHNGVDFASPVGTPVYAMADGVVIGTGNSDKSCPGASYGIWVLIRYDNYLTSIYGHLSLLKVDKGDPVSRGDIVGYSGSTGYATGPHLHLSVYPQDGVVISSFPSKACPTRTLTIPVAAANAYLDPMEYLPKL